MANAHTQKQSQRFAGHCAVRWFCAVLVVAAFAWPARSHEQTFDLTLEDALRLYQERDRPLSPTPTAETTQNPLARAERARLKLQQERALKQAFWGALHAQFLWGETQGNLQYLDDWIGIVAARVEVGATPASDLTLLQNERSQLADELKRAQLLRQQATARLRLALGLPVNAALNVLGAFQSNVPVLYEENLLAEAEANHPELRLARLQGASQPELAALRLRIAVELQSAVAAVEAWRNRPERLQLTELPRAVDAQSTEDTRYFERLGPLLPLLEAARTRRAVRLAWLRARYELQCALLAIELATGKVSLK